MRVYEINKCKVCKKDIQVEVGECRRCKSINEYWTRKKQNEYFCKNYNYVIDEKTNRIAIEEIESKKIIMSLNEKTNKWEGGE